MDAIPLDIAAERRAKANGARAPSSALDVQSSVECRVELSRPYIVKGLIHPGELSVWFGPPGCGKTFLAQYMAHAIAQGRSIFGRRVQQATSLYLALEGEGGFKKRMAALNQQCGDAPNFFYYAQPLNLFSNHAQVAAVIDAVREYSADLLIVDTLSRAMSGGNENAPEDMTQMIGVFDRIRSQTGAHVASIHHTGKDIERGGRGHNSLKGAVDVEGEVSKTETGDRVLRIIKARDDSDGQAHGFKLRVVDLGADDDGDPITTCVVEESGDVPRPAPSMRLAKGDLQALAWLREAIDEHGDQAPSHLPPVRVVTKDKWSLIAKKRTSETSDEAIRKAIARAITNLTVAKMIGVNAPYFWVIK